MLSLLTFSTLFALSVLAMTHSSAPTIDLSHAVVVSYARPAGPEAKAVQMLVDEVESRTRVRWSVRRSAPRDGSPYIVVGDRSAYPVPPAIAGQESAWNATDGYAVVSTDAPSAESVVVLGADARGTLYGVGRLLRNLHMSRDKVTVDSGLKIASKPSQPLRGHQLGYRPKTNSYDGWNIALWEHYVRDLAVFGANAVELIPPRSDDDADSPLFPKPPMEMMTAMSRLLDSYGMEVWVWYPAMDPHYDDPATVKAAVKEWGEVFRKLPRIDAVFVPGGDPGHTEPKYLMAMLKEQAASLHRYHPKAKIWVSPQGFTTEWMNQFLGILRNERPQWFGGVVFGPQVRIPLPELRKLVPSEYPIRHYPDITHSFKSQFPVDDWDVAYCLTEGREGINPRPLAEARMCRFHQPYTIGTISYSEGCNDDVNKAIWSALEWNPDTDVKQILTEYSRYFISDRFADSFADGLLDLEQNWNGPLEDNAGVLKTLERFQAMEKAATIHDKTNWRFLQALYRAYYDAYCYYRVRYEGDAERRAITALDRADQAGWKSALESAEAELAHNGPVPGREDLRTRIQVLAEALFQTIRMQLSVPLYDAISFDRGANLDRLHQPLNNRVWLEEQFAEIRAMPSDEERMARIHRLAHWTDPGPGGFYDDLGDPRKRPHLLPGMDVEHDPGHMHGVRMGHDEDEPGRVQWDRYAETLYETPIEMEYTGLDPNAKYRLRVVYGPDNIQYKVHLTANGKIEVHPWLTKPSPMRPLEFEIPREATAGGTLKLSWVREPGKGGNGRGAQVSEVWLMKE
jgi:hypothetical protein